MIIAGYYPRPFQEFSFEETSPAEGTSSAGETSVA
jgi:hypothetical protein